MVISKERNRFKNLHISVYQGGDPSSILCNLLDSSQKFSKMQILWVHGQQSRLFQSHDSYNKMEYLDFFVT